MPKTKQKPKTQSYEEIAEQVIIESVRTHIKTLEIRYNARIKHNIDDIIFNRKTK